MKLINYFYYSTKDGSNSKRLGIGKIIWKSKKIKNKFFTKIGERITKKSKKSTNFGKYVNSK